MKHLKTGFAESRVKPEGELTNLPGGIVRVQ